MIILKAIGNGILLNKADRKKKKSPNEPGFNH